MVLMICPGCHGKKKVMRLGMDRVDCIICAGIGNIDKAVFDCILTKASKEFNVKEATSNTEISKETANTIRSMSNVVVSKEISGTVRSILNTQIKRPRGRPKVIKPNDIVKSN